MNFLSLIIGLLLGFVIAWLFFQYQKYKAGFEQDTEKTQQTERLRLLSENWAKSQTELETKNEQVIDLKSQLAAQEVRLEQFSSKTHTQEQELVRLQEVLTLQFEKLANQFLEEKSQKLNQQNKTELGEILEPLRNKLKEFEQKITETYQNEARERFSLEKEIRNLVELNHQLGTEAQNLTQALKGQVKTQGNWGEMILESVLEKSGLVKNREYFAQKSYRDAQGRLFQPDIVVAYPQNRYVVIDSKVSLLAFERYGSAENKTDQDKALADHIFSIKQHISQLSQKNYQNLPFLNSLDFVMMFVPIEPAYLLAVQNEPNLWQMAYEKRILLISPTHLITALKMVAVLWRQELQNKNALEIAQKSGALYDKIVAVVQDLTQMGKKLEDAQHEYREGMAKLYTGKGNLLRRAEELRELGAKNTKVFPNSLMERIEE